MQQQLQESSSRRREGKLERNTKLSNALFPFFPSLPPLSFLFLLRLSTPEIQTGIVVLFNCSRNVIHVSVCWKKKYQYLYGETKQCFPTTFPDRISSNRSSDSVSWIKLISRTTLSIGRSGTAAEWLCRYAFLLFYFIMI